MKIRFILGLGALAFVLAAEAKVTDTAGLLGDWTASGNGCRGSQKEPTSQSKVMLTVPNSSFPNSYLIRFIAHSMRLQTPLENEILHLKKVASTQEVSADALVNLGSAGKKSVNELIQATECSLRIALFPPQGKRIRNVTASSTATVNKGKNFAAWVSSELAIGNQTVAEVRLDYKDSEAVNNRKEEFVLIPGKKEGQNIPVSKCGQPRILAFNSIFAAERKQVSDESNMALGNKGVVEIFLDLEDCK